MKKLLFLVSLIFCYSLSNQAMAESDYKCYVGLSSAESIILWRFDNSAAAAKKALKDMFVSHNKRKLKINYVHECVLARQNFASEDAQILDLNTRH